MTRRATVTALNRSPAFFALLGDCCLRDGTGFGCYCARCNRAVSAPHEYQGRVVWCIYCALDAGHLPAVEIEDWPGASPYGLSPDEAKILL